MCPVDCTWRETVPISAPSSQCSMCPVIVREVKQFQYLPHLPSVVCVPWIAHDVKQFQYLLDRQRHFVILSVSHSRVCLCQAGDHWCDDALSDGSPRWRNGYMNIETAFRPRLLMCVRTNIACVCVCVCARAHWFHSVGRRVPRVPLQTETFVFLFFQLVAIMSGGWTTGGATGNARNRIRKSTSACARLLMPGWGATSRGKSCSKRGECRPAPEWDGETEQHPSEMERRRTTPEWDGEQHPSEMKNNTRMRWKDAEQHPSQMESNTRVKWRDAEQHPTEIDAEQHPSQMERQRTTPEPDGETQHPEWDGETQNNTPRQMWDGETWNNTWERWRVSVLARRAFTIDVSVWRRELKNYSVSFERDISWLTRESMEWRTLYTAVYKLWHKNLQGVGVGGGSERDKTRDE